MTLIYHPEEDSYLLEKVILDKIPKLLKNNLKLKLLEIGIGSGIQLKAVAKAGIKKENIFGVDINIDAVNHCRSLGFKCMKSNLFENIKEIYDIIIFNPPYLPEDDNPEDEESKLITTGGRLGSKIPNKFLKQAKSHLKENGKIYFLISSLTKGVDWQNYKKELIAEKKIFFEKLMIYELTLIYT